MYENIAELKTSHLNQLADYREMLFEKPKLKFLFLELTTACNLRCLHCGSRCTPEKAKEKLTLTVDDYRRLLVKVKEDFDELPFLNITGGEPLVYPHFEEVMQIAVDLGYEWGMTTNAILIDEAMARKLKELKMAYVSVSLDGLEETHDVFRQQKGSYRAAMAGIENLIKVGGYKQLNVTTAVNKSNIDELEAMYQMICDSEIDTWRLAPIETIGRASDHDELLLDGEDHRRMLDFIREKRLLGMPVTYSCMHFLGLDYERVVRNSYYLCNAGIYVASIRTNGDIGSCLAVEHRPETIYGNILKDDFTKVWKEGFKNLRMHKSELSSKCKDCEQKRFCDGGSCHNWNFDTNEPNSCFKDILF